MKEPDEKQLAEVVEATKVLADTQISNPEEAIIELTARGYSLPRAEKLYFFVELAFGRAVIERNCIGDFPGTYIADSVDAVQTEHRLTDDPYYETALHVARCLVENKVRDVVRPVASRSCEIAAFEKVLDSGEKLEGIIVRPPRWTSKMHSSEWEVF